MLGPPAGAQVGMNLAMGHEFNSQYDQHGRTARVLSLIPRHAEIALEVMNEPQIGWDDPASSRVWQTMVERLYAAARFESQDLDAKLRKVRTPLLHSTSTVLSNLLTRAWKTKCSSTVPYPPERAVSAYGTTSLVG
jgi:hypothetical protein